MSPFFLTVAGLVVLLLALLVWGTITLTKHDSTASTPTATIETIVQLPADTLKPVITLTPTLASPTPTPVLCKAARDTQAYAEPKQVTIKEPVPYGSDLPVVKKLENDGVQWFEVLISGTTRYVPFDDVVCPAP